MQMRNVMNPEKFEYNFNSAQRILLLETATTDQIRKSLSWNNPQKRVPKDIVYIEKSIADSFQPSNYES